MKTSITFFLLLITSLITKAQVSFSGKLPYKTTPENSWEGIAVELNMGIKGSITQGGVTFEIVLYDKYVNSIKIRQREIFASQIPAAVLSNLKNNIRVSSVSYDLYVNSTFVKKLYGPSTIGWAEVQGLNNSEGYKQAVKDAGIKIFNNGGLTIQNVSITGVTYLIDQGYRNTIEKEVTGEKTAVSTPNPTSNDKVTELGLQTPSGTSSDNKSNINPAGIGQSESSAGRTTATSPKPWTRNQVNDYLERGAASRQAQEQVIQQKSAATMSVINAVGNYFADKAEQKRLASERAFEAELAAEEEKIERKRAENALKEQLRTNRTALVTSFNGGKVPLSSQKVTADEIYFFCFSYDHGAIENPNMTMYVSSVFPIARYSDGTWPFTATLLDNIARTNNGAKVELSGFYTSLENAEQKRQEFIEGINDLSLTQGTLTYKGKKASGSESTDFWGNPKSPEQAKVKAADKKTEAESKAETDFWGNPVNNEVKKADNADFWGESEKPKSKKPTTAPKIKTDKKN